MKRVKATIEVLVDVEDWVDNIEGNYYDENDKWPSKDKVLSYIKKELQDLEVLSNNLRQYKVISVKETKQQEFKY